MICYYFYLQDDVTEMLVFPHFVECEKRLLVELGVLPVEVWLWRDSLLLGGIVVVLGRGGLLGTQTDPTVVGKHSGNNK